MKLSDAIEAGWADLDQVHGPYFLPEQSVYDSLVAPFNSEQLSGVCALGAACVAVEPASKPGVRVWRHYWPELLEFATADAYPALPLEDPLFKSCNTVCDFVTFLNDSLRLSKEEVIEQVRKWGL